MVRTYQRKYTNSRNGKSHPPYLRYSQEDLQKAIEAVQNGNLKVKDAAEHYNIPISTLSRKYRHKNCTQEKAGHPTLFSKEEEKSFVEYIQLLSHWGFPFDSTDLRIFAQKYLNKIGKTIYGLKDNIPGVDWARNFLIRHKHEISNRTASNISSDRAKTTEQEIDEFFDRYEKSIEGVSPDCLINYDETNLTDDPGNKKYIFKRGCKYPERVINSSKSSISLMFAGTADGQSLPIYVVYKADHLWDQWLEGGPEGTRYNRSKSGWFDSVCFEDWFHTIIVPYARKKPGRKVVIGDNLSSHFSQSVLQTCSELNITFICLPPKTTHLLQPLDVAFYAPLKRYWRDVLTKWKKTEGLKHKTLVKSSFPKLLKKLKNKLVESGTESINLIAGFNKCGLYPINSDRPKSRLPQRQIIPEEEIENAASSAVIEILQEMRCPTSATGQTKRKRKCNVPPGMSITADDIAITKPLQQQKRKNTQKRMSGKKKNQKSLTISNSDLSDKDMSNTDSDITGGFKNEESNLLDTQPIAGPSGLCNAYASGSTYVSSDDQSSQHEKIIETRKKPATREYVSFKGKGKGKKSKVKIEESQLNISDLKNKPASGEKLSIKRKGKGNKIRPKLEKKQMKISDLKNLDLDPVSIQLLIASVKAEKSKTKKTKRDSKDSDTTSVSDLMSVHSDSDIIDVNFSENSSDDKSNDEGYECNKDMSDCTYIKQPTAENSQIPDDDDKIIARSYVPAGYVKQKTDGNITTKLEYETDKTDNNPRNLVTICDNIDLEEDLITQKDESEVHELYFYNNEPTDTKDLQNSNIKDCKMSSVRSYVTAGSIKQKTYDSLKTALEYGIYKTDKNVSTSALISENIDLPEPEISKAHESNDSHQENVDPLQIQKDFELDLDMYCNENDRNYNNTRQEHVESNQELEEHVMESVYAVNDHVLVRYCDGKKCKHYVGFIENIKIDGRKYNYTVNFFKTIKKPQLAFRITKKIDRDEVDDIWIIKKVLMNINPNAEEFLLAEKSDEMYF